MSKLIKPSMILIFLLLMAAQAHAGGIGLFLSGGEVDAEWDGDYTNIESEGTHRDFGFTVDSNLNTEKLFNYRLELGRAEWEPGNFNNRGVEADIDGLVMNHDFGFGSMIAPSVRLWFGPEIRLTLLEGELEGVNARDIDLFGYGFGGAVGVNFSLPGRLTLAAKTGFVMMRYLGDGPNWTGSTWQNSDYDVDEDLVYVGVSMFFRTRSTR
mgnify:CR=1 FL=1